MELPSSKAWMRSWSPGGFGRRGTEGKIAADPLRPREQDPLSGNLSGYAAGPSSSSLVTWPGSKGANSSEFDPESPHRIVGLISEWLDRSGNVEHRDAESDLGGTMRLGAQRCPVKPGTLAASIYGTEVNERHRHRYEVNNRYVDQLEAAGLVVLGAHAQGKPLRDRRAS